MEPKLLENSSQEKDLLSNILLNQEDSPKSKSSTASEQIKKLKQFIEQKDLDSFSIFLDNTSNISKNTLNIILSFALQNYRSNFEMMEYIQLLTAKGADQNCIFHYVNKSQNQGPKIDEKDNVTVLMYACLYADIHLIETLAVKKNINMKDKNGKNALFYAILSDKGDNPDVIGFLIQHGIDVNCVGKIEINEKNFETHSPLSLAASKNMINTFKTLLDQDADPNFQISPSNDSILHICVKNNNIDMIKLLLKTNKIKFEVKNKEGKTAQELLSLETENGVKINNLILEKIEESNRQSAIIAEELLCEDQKNLAKKQNNNLNLLNVNKNEEENKKINKNIPINNPEVIICNNNSNNFNKNKKIHKKEIINQKHHDNKIKILNEYLYLKYRKSNSSTNLQIHVSFPNKSLKNNFNDVFYFSNENTPILNVDLFSEKFKDYKNFLNLNTEIKNNQLKKLEEENKSLKKEIDILKNENRNLLQNITEKESHIKEIENKYQLSIKELTSKISLLEKEHEIDKNSIIDLKKEISELNEKKSNTENSNTTNNSNKNIINNTDINNKSFLQYLNKKFIHFDYNYNFDLNTYVINCLSKDIYEYEIFVNEHITKSKNIYDTLVNNLQIAVNEAINDYEVHLYGSHSTNLCLPWSDLDVVLIHKNDFNKNSRISSETKHFLLSKLSENLRHQSWVKDCNYISGATIPIIKIVAIEKYNKMHIDISIQDEKHFGLKCVELVKKFMNKYDSLKPLVLAIKNMLKIANLNDPYKGGISSYGLILMIVYFLQTQKKNGADISKNENGTNLGNLFYNFIHFYAVEFDFNKYIIVVSVNNEDENDDFQYNINFMQNSGLIIVDPLNTENNVAKSCYQLLNLKMTFIVSLKALLEDCECGCHYNEDGEEYSNLKVEHCFLKRIFNSVRRFLI